MVTSPSRRTLSSKSFRPTTARDVQSRIDTWLRAGVKVAWVIYPASQAVLVYRGMDRIERRSGDEELGAESAIPGFRCKAGDLFPGGAS